MWDIGGSLSTVSFDMGHRSWTQMGPGYFSIWDINVGHRWVLVNSIFRYGT